MYKILNGNKIIVIIYSPEFYRRAAVLRDFSYCATFLMNLWAAIARLKGLIPSLISSIRTDVYKYMYIWLYIFMYIRFSLFSAVSGVDEQAKTQSGPKFVAESLSIENPAFTIFPCVYARTCMCIYRSGKKKLYIEPHAVKCTRLMCSKFRIRELIIIQGFVSQRARCHTDLSSSFR